MNAVPKSKGRIGNQNSSKFSFRALLVASAILFLRASIAPAANEVSATPAIKTGATNTVEKFKQPATLAELLKLPPEQLERVDIAVLNLLCAEGLRGSDGIDMKLLLDRLDALSVHVERETKRNQHLFDEHPEKFKNSLAYFRMAMVATVLVQDFRIQYNPDRERQLENGHKLKSDEEEKKFFGDSKDVFIHGLLDGKHYGTCASMPFIYVAVARRLGYPVTLATTASHFYVRYEEGNGKHLNVEATEHRAFITPSDDEYKNPWEMHVGAEEIIGLGHLRPLSNKEILGHSLLTRSEVLRSMKQYDKQAETWATAARYLPATPMWKGIVHDMQQISAHEGDQEKRNALWDRVAQLFIPRGGGYVYFQDKRVRLHFLVNHSADMAAVETAVKDFETELAAYVKPLLEPLPDQLIEPPNQPQQRLVLRYTAASGKEVTLPADLLPPFERRAIPPEVATRVAERKLEDEDSILAEFWKFYDEMALAKQRARQQRMMQSGAGPMLIARERVPQDYWDSIPPQLQLRLSGLKHEDEVVKEMWVFQREQAIRQEDEQRRESMTAQEQATRILRQSGIRQSPGNRQPTPASLGAPDWYNKRESKIPEIYWEWISPEAEKRLSPADIWMLNQHAKNLQTLKAGTEWKEQIKEAGMPKLMNFQLVPASLLNSDATVQKVSPNSPLTPQPAGQITPSETGKGKP